MKTAFATVLLCSSALATSLRGSHHHNHNHTSPPASVSAASPEPAAGHATASNQLTILQTSMPLVPTVDFAPALGSGTSTCHYPGMLLPELSAPLTTSAREQTSFVYSQVVPLKLHTGMFSSQFQALSEDFSSTITKNGKSNSTATFFADQENLFNGIYPTGPRGSFKNISNVQGSNGAWKSDRYASELLGHTLLASFLTTKSDGVYELDFTGTSNSIGSGSGALSTRTLKDEVVDLAPKHQLLRCKAELVSKRTDDGTKSRPALTTITVYSSDGDPVLTATPADGVKWELAKVVLHGMGAFVLQSFHTGVHLMASVTTTAAVRSLPRETLLNGMFDAQNTLVVTAIWEQMAFLHNDSPSMWNKQVWDCDIKEVRRITVKLARYLLQVDPREFLSMQDGTTKPKPEWWGGGAANFIAPIEKFARSVAQGAITDARNYGQLGDATSYLEVLQQQLLENGALGENTTATPSLDVTTEDGLAGLYTNMVFFESVFHGAIFATRECFLPIAMPMTAQFLPYLVGAPGAAAGVETIEDAINKFVTTDNMLREKLTPIVHFANMMYSTGSGFDGAVEISEGPYYNTGSWHRGESHIKQYQDEIHHARSKIMGVFGTEFAVKGTTGDGFLPGYYYPTDAAKPSGYSMTETVYI